MPGDGAYRRTHLIIRAFAGCSGRESFLWRLFCILDENFAEKKLFIPSVSDLTSDATEALLGVTLDFKGYSNI